MKKIQKRDQEYIKQKNKKMILDIIKNKKPISRADIVKLTGMSATSVSRIVASLIEQGLVKETKLYSGGVGRKAVLLDIDSESILTIGVYLDRDIITAGIVNFAGDILYEKQIASKITSKNPQMTIEKVCCVIQELIDTSKVNISKVLGICVGLPGIIDYKHGEVIFSAQLGWKNVNLSKQIEEKLNIKTIIDNDVKLIALAESLYGAAKSSKRSALISFGSGVGSALIINGEISRGATNIAGEIGHITLDPNGRLCDCGRRGCLETFIVERSLIEEANKIKKVTDVRQIFDACNNNEAWAKNILDRTVTYICIAINNIVCMYNPDTIILSGNLINQNIEIINLIEEKCKMLIWDHVRNSFKIEYSQLKERAIITGAAALALNTNLVVCF